jgi:hypothetical protein
MMYPLDDGKPLLVGFGGMMNDPGVNDQLPTETCRKCGKSDVELWLTGEYFASNPAKYATVYLCSCGWFALGPQIRRMSREELKAIGMELPSSRKIGSDS